VPTPLNNNMASGALMLRLFARRNLHKAYGMVGEIRLVVAMVLINLRIFGIYILHSQFIHRYTKWRTRKNGKVLVCPFFPKISLPTFPRLVETQ
jgi:hypothetical protein